MISTAELRSDWKKLPKERARMFHAFKRFAADESGATSIEYGLICAGIALAIIAIINSLGGDLVAVLTRLLNNPAFG
jgi:pilus assembly protein Flp/PilA